MLAIKLPKGKTGAAFERAAVECSARIRIINNQHVAELERWRKGAHMLNTTIYDPILDAPERPREISILTDKRSRYQRMADACKHSTGDVYLDADTWDEIKGYY
jgi:hypothetical protein